MRRAHPATSPWPRARRRSASVRRRSVLTPTGCALPQPAVGPRARLTLHAASVCRWRAASPTSGHAGASARRRASASGRSGRSPPRARRAAAEPHRSIFTARAAARAAAAAASTPAPTSSRRTWPFRGGATCGSGLTASGTPSAATRGAAMRRNLRRSGGATLLPMAVWGTGKSSTTCTCAHARAPNSG